MLVFGDSEEAVDSDDGCGDAKSPLKLRANHPLLRVACLLVDNMQVDLNDKGEQGVFLGIDFRELDCCVVELGERSLEVGDDDAKYRDKDGGLVDKSF